LDWNELNSGFGELCAEILGKLLVKRTYGSTLKGNTEGLLILPEEVE
jgi:hypothetical protein